MSNVETRPLYFTTTGGMFSTFYTASEVCGTYIITAECKGIEGSCKLIVRVDPPLEWMPPGTNYYWLHYNPAVDFRHSRRHFGTSYAVSSLRHIAIRYKQRFPYAPPLQYNDMSLAWGGLFDYEGTWNPPHSLHRYGRDCDLRIAYGTLPVQYRDWLRNYIFMQFNGSVTEKDDPPHWHITFHQ